MIKRKLSRGFTLIELMIVVAIVGILASIAYPSYQEQIAKSKRAGAKSELLQSQQWMERFYSESYRYDKNAAGTDVNDATLFKSKFEQSPRKGEGAAAFLITVVATQTGYTLSATRTGSMAADRCGDYLMLHTGRKSLTNYSSTSYATEADAIKACW